MRVAIAGAGNVGRSIAAELLGNGHEVLLIEKEARALKVDTVPQAEWLDDADTLTYLHSCISTKRHRVRVPEVPIYLDAILPDEALTGGLEPRLGNVHLRTLTVLGFPSVTYPGILDDLNRLPFAYRWSTRAIALDKVDATRVLTRIRRQWFPKPIQRHEPASSAKKE